MSTPNGSMLDVLPDCMKAHVVQYLKFDDVLEGNHIPDDILFQYIKWTDMEEPIRYIFRDFESVDDARRLPRLQSLMKSVDFMSYFSFWDSVLDLTLTYECDVYFHLTSQDYFYQGCIDNFLNWIKAAEDSPAKEYVLSKVGHKAELIQIMERGRRLSKETQRFEYTPTLSPVFVDFLGRLITKGDQESVLLFDQLLTNPDLKKYFSRDLQEGVFRKSLAQIFPTGGQPNVLLNDEVVNRIHVSHLTGNMYGLVIDSAVSHDRFDVLDGILKKFEGFDFYRLFIHMFDLILRAAYIDPENDCKKDPGYDYKLAKDLLRNNIDAIRNAPQLELGEYETPYFGDSLPDDLVSSIIDEDPTPHEQSLFFFMMEQFKSNGIQVCAEEALIVASERESDFYKDYFINCL